MALVRKVAGNTIGAVDANQQFYDLFTGAMTDQPVTFGNFLNLNFNSTSFPTSLGGGAGGSISANFSSGGGELDFWNTLNAAAQSFRFYQKTGASAATLIATMYATGGVFLGTSPTDPGGGILATTSGVVCGGGTNGLSLSTAIGTNPTLGKSGSDLQINLTNPGVVNFGNGTVSGHTTAAGVQLHIKAAGTDFYIPLQT